jgi:large subunit ribosomal protein L28
MKTKRRQQANVQKVRALVNGTVTRVHACTRCVRAGRVAKIA